MGYLHEEVHHFGIHFFSSFFVTTLTDDHSNKWDDSAISLIFSWLALCLSHPGGEWLKLKFAVAFLLFVAAYFYNFRSHKKPRFCDLNTQQMLKEVGVLIFHLMFDVLIHVELGESLLASVATSLFFCLLMALWEYGGWKKQCKFVIVGMSIASLSCHYVYFFMSSQPDVE